MSSWNNYYVDPTNGNNSTGDGLSEGTAWESVAHALSAITRDATNGDAINIKTGATPEQSAPWDLLTYASSGSAAAPLAIAGYSSIIGDSWQANVNANASTLVNASGFKDIALRNMSVSNWSGVAVTVGLYSQMISMTFDGGGVSGNVCAPWSYGTIANCVGVNLSLPGIERAFYCGSGVSIYNCYVESDMVYPVALGVGSMCANNLIIQTGSGYCINGGSSISVTGNTLIAKGVNPVYGGIRVGYNAIIASNYIEGYISGYGIYVGPANKRSVVANNRAYNCVSPFVGFADASVWDIDNQVLAASGLTDVAGGDYTPLASLQAGAWPKTVPYQGQSYLRDIGALQHPALYLRRPRIFR